MTAPRAALLAALLLCAAPPAAADLPARRTEYLFSTVVTLVARDPGGRAGDAALERALAWCRDFDRRFAPGTGERLAPLANRRAGERIPLDPDLARMLDHASRAHLASGGLYDPTVGPLVEAYGFKTPAPGDPPEEIRRAAHARVGFARLRLHGAPSGTRELEFLADGVALDVGGLAKGYAVDRAYEILLAAGVRSGFVDLGGDVRALGDRGGRPFTIGVTDPERAGRLLATLTLTPGEAVATSGDYERFFLRDGRRICHILDPLEGRPGTRNKSATAIADSGARAQFLSLASFLMPAGRALAFCEAQGGALLLVDAAGTLHMSPRMAERCVMTSTFAARDARFFAFVFVAIGIAFLLFPRGHAPARFARVEAAGSPAALLPLSVDGRHAFAGPLGATVVEIRGGGARVAGSPCPDKLCMQTGTLRHAGGLIVCAPNRVAVRLEAEPADPADPSDDAVPPPDAVTGRGVPR